MTHDEFWVLLDEARASRRGIIDALVDALAQLPSDEIVAFDGWSRAYRSALYRQDLWAAIYLIQGGCSDDGFDYFQAWLIAQGERAVLAAVRDPASLADLTQKGGSLEELLSVADEAHQRAFGRELPDSAAFPAIPDLATWPPDRIAPDVKWSKRDVLKTIYPTLWTRFGWQPKPTGEIEHARFWQIIAAARAECPGPFGDKTVATLSRLLDAGPESERIGFARWVYSYNQALVRRNDLRAVARVLTGTDSIFMATHVRGWLLGLGPQVLDEALRDPDSLAAVVPHEPEVVVENMIALGWHVDEDDRLAIPGSEAWSAD